MILVDTSAWVAFFRGHEPLASAVDAALADNVAVLCGPVLTELRRGLQTDRERKRVLPLLDGCSVLAQPADLWAEAGDLGFALRRRGVTCKTLDLLIAVHALAYGVPLLTEDSDFAVMQKAGVPLVLAPHGSKA
jgi:predicted nucleic acid-binding protein